MRRLLALGLLAAMSLRAVAAKRMTVAELEHTLIADGASKKQDAQIVRQIAEIELTERLTDTSLIRLSVHLSPGSAALQALELLADQSAFLDPPQGELPTTAAPDSATQLHMLDAVRSYVSQTMPRLPNFLATRVIKLYDDSPQSFKKSEWPTRAGLHLVGTSSGQISVREERENQPATQGSAVWQAKIGLVSGGEFGNTLGMILADAAKGDVAWSHWENSATGMVAVFHYSVPAPASHYEVLSSLQREALIEGFSTTPTGGRGISSIGTRPNVNGRNNQIVRTRPGYHGSIWVNPADGTILRVTLDADLKNDASFRRAAILVQYGPVEIGGSTFTCPVRGLAFSQAVTNAAAVSGDAPTEWMNETFFTGYHHFAATARILTESADSSAPESPSGTPSERTAQSSGAATEAVAPVAQQIPVPATPPQPTADAAAPVQSPPVHVAASPAAKVDSLAPPAAPAAEASAATSTANQLQSSPVPQLPSTPDSGFTLRVEVQALLVPAVVHDKKGIAVGSLGKSDFTVLDQGKPRSITGFTLVKSEAAGEQRSIASASSSGSAASAPAVEATPASSQNRFIIFLFDDRHLNSSDLAFTQKAATKLLGEPLGPTEFADVLSFMGVNSGMTHDSAELQSAVMKLSVHQANQNVKEDCPDVDYFSAYRIVTEHDATEFQVAVQKARNCSGVQMNTSSSPQNLYSGIDNPTDPYQRMALSAAARAIAVGEEDARQTLLSIENVVHAMTKLPGQRTLILVSPGFLSISPEAMNFKSKVLDEAAGANVVINAIDARGLYAGNVDASEGNSISQMNGATSQNHPASMQASEDAMAELAAGTGGVFFHNNNDLGSGLRSLAAAPDFLYLLEISLSGSKPNGSYHRLQVKVDKPGLDVEARKGYYAPKPTRDAK